MARLKNRIFDLKSSFENLWKESIDKWLYRDEGYHNLLMEERLDKKYPRIKLHSLFLSLVFNRGFRRIWKRWDFWGFWFLNGFWGFGFGNVLNRSKNQLINVPISYQNTPYLLGLLAMSNSTFSFGIFFEEQVRVVDLFPQVIGNEFWIVKCAIRVRRACVSPKHKFCCLGQPAWPNFGVPSWIPRAILGGHTLTLDL